VDEGLAEAERAEDEYLNEHPELVGTFPNVVMDGDGQGEAVRESEDVVAFVRAMRMQKFPETLQRLALEAYLEERKGRAKKVGSPWGEADLTEWDMDGLHLLVSGGEGQAMFAVADKWEVSVRGRRQVV